MASDCLVMTTDERRPLQSAGQGDLRPRDITIYYYLITTIRSSPQVKEISDRVMALKKRYTENVDSKEQLRKESEELEIKLGRAQARLYSPMTA